MRKTNIPLCLQNIRPSFCLYHSNSLKLVHGSSLHDFNCRVCVVSLMKYADTHGTSPVEGTVAMQESLQKTAKKS